MPGRDVPDYSRPSVDVARRVDAEWQWGVTHTVRPEKLAPMLPDVEYRITVKVQRRVAEMQQIGAWPPPSGSWTW